MTDVAGYRLIDHTADIGIAVEAGTMADLFRQAALALFDQILDRDTVVGSRTAEIAVSGADAEELMFNWLREVLFLWTGKETAVRSVDIVAITPVSLRARIAGEPFDTGRHTVNAEIKAVTYHRLAVEGDDRTGWKATVILDV